MIVATDGVVYVSKKPIIIRENRMRYANTTHYSVLAGLEFNQEPITVLNGDDEITYFASNLLGYEQFGQGNYQAISPILSGWVGTINLPAEAGLMTIEWTVKIGGSVEVVQDKVKVISR